MSPRPPLVALLCVLCIAPVALAQTHPPGFDDVLVVGGLSQPTVLAMAPDGRLLVGERTGAIRVVAAGVLLPKPLLELDVETYDEQGLDGFALDPQFPARPFLYVFYTPYTGVAPAPKSVLSRFTVAGDSVLAGSEVVLLDSLPALEGYHLGGCVRTSADDHLWLSTGDGGQTGEDLGWSRDLDRLEGKLLRLNLDGSVPADNPFVGVPGALAGIWQLGLRNPFRFAIRDGTLQPVINDVGSSRWEEVNLGPPGADFGWPDHEGTVQPAPAGVTNPLYTYPHAGSGASVTGAAFYTGSQFPAGYQGSYFFLEHSRGQIGRIVLDGSNAIESVTVPWGTTAGWGWGSGPVDLLAGNDGALYYTQYSGGQVRRITYPSPAGVEPAIAGLSFAAPRPNPSRDQATLRFSLPAPGHARLAIHDTQGRHVRTLVHGVLPAGVREESWDGAGPDGQAMPPGIYHARLEAAGNVLVRRLARLP